MVDELEKIYKRKILSGDEIVTKLSSSRAKKKVIMCHGVFDVVHPGHLRHLAYAKSKADLLIVSLTCDRWIKKGPYRPHVPEGLRALSLAALDLVDFVIVDHNETPLENIRLIKPDFFAKGFEYSDKLPQATLEEIEIVNSYGGETIFTPGDIVYSSTTLINNHQPNLKLEKLRIMMSQFDLTFDAVEKALNQLTGISVHVVGDTIVDSYTRTSLIGGNTKTPTFSVLFNSREDYVGGAGIVAQHLQAAGGDVTFSTMLGDDELGQFARQHLQDSGIKLHAITAKNRPTTNKNAIIASGYRLLKVDTLDNAAISLELVQQFCDLISANPTDCVIFSDFRHGIFNKGNINAMKASISDGTFAVADSQLASRWGNITDFVGFDLVTPNEREARFAIADQDCNIVQLSHAIKNQSKSSNVILKLGPKGLFFLGKDVYQSIDSFVDDVKDAVGSGDALLAYSTLTMKATGNLPLACLIGNIAAGCECEIDGNEPITLDLMREKLGKIREELA